MKVIYNPDKNIEARIIRGLFKEKNNITAKHLCRQLDLKLPDLSEILLRLGEFQLLDCMEWPLNFDTEIVLEEYDLIIGKEYDVLLVAFGSYRILSEGYKNKGRPEPYQFHRELFEISDNNIPNGWVAEWFDGEVSIHPPGWDNSLFANYFDGKEKAKNQFESELKLYFPESYQRLINSTKYLEKT